jgi:hypothetical protein
MWWHHNPLQDGNIYNYVVRCVDRFKKLLQYNERKLFIMMFHEMDENEKNKIIEFNNKFSIYTKNYALLVISYIPNKERNHIFTYKDNIHFLELHTNTKTNGIEFDSQDDNNYLDNIITTNYHFRLKRVT